MAISNVELYEALKEPVGEKAARLIAEVFHASRELATKQDLQTQEIRLLRWMIVLFVPLYAGIFGIMTTLIVTA